MRFIRENPDDVEKVWATAGAKAGLLAKSMFEDEPLLAERFQLMRAASIRSHIRVA